MKKYLGDVTPLDRLIGGIGICFIAAGVLIFFEVKNISWEDFIKGISCFVIGILFMVIMGIRGTHHKKKID